MTQKLVGFKSEKNSSSTALGSSETFTGDWEDVSSYDTVSFALKTDQTCTLYADFTSDVSGSTDSTLTYNISANINEVHRLTITRQFFRLRIVNNGTAQSSLSLSTMIGSHPQLSAPLNLTMGLDADATVVRPSIGEDEIVLGRRAGIRHFNKFALREGLTAAAGEQMIWNDSSNTFTPMTSADTFTISYNNATDGDGTTGALTLYIQYVDANGLPAVAVHTLGSTGSDTTSFTGLGINRIAVSSSGSNDVNVNTISLVDTTNTTHQATISAGEGVTQQAVYFVGSNSKAVGKFMWINANKISGGGSPRIVIKGWVYNRNVETKFEIFRVTMDTQSNTNMSFVEPVGFVLNETDIFYMTADTDTNNAEVNVRFSFREYDND